MVMNMQDNTYFFQKLNNDLRDIVSDVLKLSVDKIQVDTNFDDFGFNSISLTEFCFVLKERYGFEITPDMLYSYPSIEELSLYLTEHETGAIASYYEPKKDDMVSEKKAQRKIETVSISKKFHYFSGYDKYPEINVEQNPGEEHSIIEPVAIVGMSGRFPGARNVDELWDIVNNGKEAITDLPLERREWNDVYGNKNNKNLKMGVIPGIAEFDPAFFEISYKEAENMDPRQRLLLLEMWNALEQAGFGTNAFKNETIGVYVGAEAGLYTPIAGKEFGITSNHDAVLAARIAYLLNLQGPNLTLNTACSSGLVALHQACQAIRCGECDSAIVGGVNLLPIPDSYQVLEQADMFSEDGRCHAFDKNANGMVPAEAAAVVILKNAKKAKKDKNPILAMIKADGINYDGKTKGLTAPSAKSQIKLLKTVYDKFHIDVNNLSYILAHGTGTKLGDPMEINALKEAFHGYTDRTGFCAVTSIKPNVGHCMAASGLVSLIGLVMAMKNGTIPASINCDELNEYITQGNSPFYINRQKKRWEAKSGEKYLAGVSAFGISGTNAHVVVESYEQEEDINLSNAEGWYLFPVSAKTQGGLIRKLRELSEYLEKEKVKDLASLSYTLVQGRIHFKYRTAFLAKDTAGIQQCISDYLAGKKSPLMCTGAANRNNSVTQEQTDRGNKYLSELASQIPAEEADALYQIGRLYCDGYERPCLELNYPKQARFIILPTYPFELKEYWAKENNKKPMAENKKSNIVDKNMLRHIMAEIVSVSEEQIEDTDSFESLGVDSVKFVDFAQRLEEISGVELDDSYPYLQWSIASVMEKINPSQELKAEQVSSAVNQNNIPKGKKRRELMNSWSVEECICYDIKEIISSILKTPVQSLEEDAAFDSFGFDSYTLIDFAIQLSEFYNKDITPDTLYSYSTIEKLKNYLMENESELMQSLYQKGITNVVQGVDGIHIKNSQADTKAAEETDLTSEQNAVAEPIAIIGISGRFPGARNADEFFNILLEQKDVLTNVPKERKEWLDICKTDEERKRRRIGVLPGIGEFEPMFFDISPREAISMDPRQRLLLEEMWKALEDAGYSPQAMKKERIGVFVGAEDTDYRTLLSEELGVVSNHNAALSARLAYFLDLKGPNFTLNTACSSGLTALHQAILSIRSGDCDTAVVAGANIFPRPEVYIGMENAGMLSEDGTCYAFDKKANGMVPAEAAAVVVIKRQKLAIACKNPIYASIIGSGVNYDGRTNGITAPSGQAQAELLKDIYKRYKVPVERISHIVTHGTGTRLGDSIEINALAEVFKNNKIKAGSCALTSVKPNIGHSLAASGIVSLIALVKALQNECIPASIHCDDVNDYIHWDKSPFYVNQKTTQWKDTAESKRIGAVSAFGIAGTNAHVVVQSYRDEDSGYITKPYYILPFTARTEESLHCILSVYAEYLKEHNETDLAAVSYTLMKGRKQFDYRCILVVQNAAEAIFLLDKALKGESLPGIYHNKLDTKVKRNEVIAATIRNMTAQLNKNGDADADYRNTMYAIAEYYALGYEDACAALFEEPYKLVHIPTYQFQNTEYWPVLKENKQSEHKNEERIHKPTVSAEVNAQEAKKDEHPTENKISLIDKEKVADFDYETVPRNKPVIDLLSVSNSESPDIRPEIYENKENNGADSGEDGMQMLLTLFESIYKGELDISTNDQPKQITKEPEAVEITEQKKKSYAELENIIDQVRQILVEELYIEPEEIGINRSFMELGVDSVIGIEIVKSINKKYGIKINTVKIYQYPNLIDFAQFIYDQLCDKEKESCHTVTENKTYKIEEATESKKSGAKNLETIIEELAESLAEELFLPVSDIDCERSFLELGVDSIIGVNWVRTLGKKYKIDINTTSIYKHPNIYELAGYIYENAKVQVI